MLKVKLILVHKRFHQWYLFVKIFLLIKKLLKIKKNIIILERILINKNININNKIKKMSNSEFSNINSNSCY